MGQRAQKPGRSRGKDYDKEWLMDKLLSGIVIAVVISAILWLFGKIDSTSLTLAAHTATLPKLETRLERIEGKVDDMNVKLNRMDQKLDDLLKK